jgi:hypothetical protein
MIIGGWGTSIAVRGAGGVGERAAFGGLLNGTQRLRSCRELLVESPALWEGGLQNLFDLEPASSFVAGRDMLG